MLADIGSTTTSLQGTWEIRKGLETANMSPLRVNGAWHLVAFTSRVMAWVDEGRATDVYLGGVKGLSQPIL